jgi:hypothetical protein
MKKLILEPHGWECTLDECGVGLFVYDKQIFLKIGYGDCECYCSNGGTCVLKGSAIVQPVISKWLDIEV